MTLEPLCLIAIIYSIYNLLKNLAAHRNFGSSRAGCGFTLEPPHFDSYIAFHHPRRALPPLPEIPRGSLVIVEGRAPIWRYGMALHLLHASPAAAIAFYDPRLGAVVVASHNPQWKVGQVVDVTLPAEH